MKRSQLALAALALVLGFGIAAVPRLLSGDDVERVTNAARGHPRAIPVAQLPTPQTPTDPQLPAAAGPEPPSPPASDPATAVVSFLRAESAGRFATSYGLLAASDRAAHRSRAGWTADHAQLPVVRSFEIGAVRAGYDHAEVDTVMGLRPELDPVVGLVPGAATATWVARPEDGGWRVAYSETALSPQYPNDASTPAAARTWLSRRAGCGSSARAALLGSEVLTRELCAGHGMVRLGTPIPLAPNESSDPFLAAYGPDVFRWARVVPITSPTRVGAVLAPLGPRWRVIGLVDLPSMQASPQQGAEL